MPADVDDGSELSFHSDAHSEGHCKESFTNGQGSNFNVVAWCPDAQEYGIYNLLICRDSVVQAEKPEELSNLKVVETRFCKFPEEPPIRRRGAGVARGTNGHTPGEDDEDCISEGDHGEVTGPASWSGRPRSWWRVHNQLGEDLLVREGVSLRSAQIRRVAPGELVQQAGLARSLTQGNAKGCIRLPVRPSGWVTADATKAGGPKYLVRASVPRWRVVWSPPENRNGKQETGVIVREEEDLATAEVTVLHRGDVVEQAGPCITLPEGIVRMPVTATIIRRADQENGEGDGANGHHEKRSSASGKTAGWVTVDASMVGGPIFFKPVSEADRSEKMQQHQQQQQQQRRRRPKAAP
mmetsp:Transcript_109508/g.316587  ORF Transcript_109508/g.316587 Transcript_109508/m.316587 type:complete len:353 (-) Transcript_109508:52-1110(-)